MSRHRYHAACVAALASCGKDATPLGDQARARWRRQALEWLEADSAGLARTLDEESPWIGSTVRKLLDDCLQSSDFASLQEEAAIARLPESEQAACRALWARVDALRARGQK
jgi:hypothetical protein